MSNPDKFERKILVCSPADMSRPYHGGWVEGNVTRHCYQCKIAIVLSPSSFETAKESELMCPTCAKEAYRTDNLFACSYELSDEQMVEIQKVMGPVTRDEIKNLIERKIGPIKWLPRPK